MLFSKHHSQILAEAFGILIIIVVILLFLMFHEFFFFFGLLYIIDYYIYTNKPFTLKKSADFAGGRPAIICYKGIKDF